MDLRKLQRIVVDALEDVKAQDIRVYNTSALSSLFERLVIASGTSNRQTRALASHVRERVKQAGGQVVSVEGEDSGEWVLVDLGDIVVHIMQPAIRSYYNLEELWGAKPVRVKLGAPVRVPGPDVMGGSRRGAPDRDETDEPAFVHEEAPRTRARKGSAQGGVLGGLRAVGPHAGSRATGSRGAAPVKRSASPGTQRGATPGNQRGATPGAKRGVAQGAKRAPPAGPARSGTSGAARARNRRASGA